MGSAASTGGSIPHPPARPLSHHSAYRWKAIDGPPLSRYFAQLTPEALAWGPFERNIYLAEDRVLCAEIIARKNCKYVLRYVKNAEGTLG